MRLTPQSAAGTAQARCTAAAEPTLNSAILAAMLTARPSRSASRAASIAALMPPSLMSLSESAAGAGPRMRLDVGERMDALVGADRDRRDARERGETLQVGVAERLLEEQKSGFARALDIGVRVRGAEAAVGVGAERRIAERLAQRMRGFDLRSQAAWCRP